MLLRASILQDMFQEWKFKWCPEYIRYLGILIPRDISQFVKSNYNKLIQDMSYNLEIWMPLNMSLWGKMNILKMNIIPRIIKSAMYGHIPQCYISKLTPYLGNFYRDLQYPGYFFKGCN